MTAGSIVLSLLLLPLPFNPPQEPTLGQRYEAAQELARAGRFPEAETELKTILAEEYGRLTRIYVALSKSERAVETAEAAANYRSQDPRLLLELAVGYLETSQFDKALDPLLRAARLQPNNADIQRTLGKTYFALANYDGAAKALEEAVRLAPNDFNSSFTLAISYLQQRQFPSAKRVFDRMIAQFGEQPRIHVAIGRAFREAGRLPEAIEAFKRAVALDSKFPGAHYNLGLAYLLNEGATAVANAEEEFKIELAANPGDFFSNYYLGITCIYQRKWEPAIEFLKTASRIQPANPDPYFQLGQAYQELQQHQQAIDVLRKAIDLNPNLAHNKFQVTTAHYRLAQSLLQTGQTEAGKKELQVTSELKARAFETAQSLSSGQTMGGSGIPEENDQTSRPRPPGPTPTPNSLDPKTRSDLEASEARSVKIISALHISVGVVQAGQRNFTGAAVEFAQAKRLNPQQPGLDYNLGLAYFRAGSYREALSPLESEIKANPANIQARWLLGLSYFNTREYSKTAELLNDVLASSSMNVELCYALASSLIKLGKIEAAEQAIQRMTELGDATRFHVLRAQLHYAGGNAEKAKEELAAALALDGQTREAHYYLGLIYSQKQMYKDAAQEFEAELTVNPNSSLARYELGKALLQKPDVAGAVSNLEMAVKLEPENADFHYELGRAYLAAGRQEDGKREQETSTRLKKQTAAGQTPQ